MRNFLFMTLLAAVIMGCQQQRKATPPDVSPSVEKMMTVDDIYKCERIISDSSLLDAKGDTAWKRVNAQVIRIKMGDKYYLRRETKEGTVTDFTYRYE